MKLELREEGWMQEGRHLEQRRRQPVRREVHWQGLKSIFTRSFESNISVKECKGNIRILDDVTMLSDDVQLRILQDFTMPWILEISTEDRFRACTS